MRKYKKIVDIFFITIIFLGPIGQFLVFKFTPIYNANLLSELYNEASWVQGKPKIAIMGSSHAKYQIIPSKIATLSKNYKLNDIVNIGENAASPFTMYVSFVKNKDKFNKLKTVYYTLDPHLLGEKYYPYNKYEKILLNYKQWKYLEKNHKKKNDYFFPFQTFVHSLKFKNSDRLITNGYSRLKHNKFNEFVQEKVTKFIYEPLELFPVSMHNIKYLKKLYDELNRQGTDLIFVLTPTYSWQKFYSKEAKEYDDMLIKMLNENMGNMKVVGSFWFEDFDLTYEDFKDDTHLAHSGAIKFTEEVFTDIDLHDSIQKKKLVNTYLYRHQRVSSSNSFRIFKRNASDFKWQPKNNIQESHFRHSVEIFDREFGRFSKIHTKFNHITSLDSVAITMGLPTKKLKLISISLYSGKNYGHFFIQPNKFNDGKIILNKYNLSKQSKHFTLKNIDQLAIRLYPMNESNILKYQIHSVTFNILEE